MRVLAKPPYVAGILAAIILTASAADARSVNTARLGGAYASVSAPSASGSIPYDAGGNPYPTGHGGLGASPDFQLVR